MPKTSKIGMTENKWIIQKINLYSSFIEEQQGVDGFKGFITEFSYKLPKIKIQNTGRIQIILKDYNTFRILNGLSIEEGQLLLEKLNYLL